MTWWEASVIARGGVAVRRSVWLTAAGRVGTSIAYVAGAGTTRAVAVFRRAGAETVVQPRVIVPVTGVASTDVITAVVARIKEGDELFFADLVGGAGIYTSMYYARDVSGATFKVSASLGGAAVNFTSDITAGSVVVGHFGAAEFLADDWEVA
jgi:hypothetical protein